MSCSHQVLQLTVTFSPGRISSGSPQRHSSSRTHPPSCRSQPSGQRQPAAHKHTHNTPASCVCYSRGQRSTDTWMTGALQTLDVIPQVSAAAGTLIGTGVLIDPPPVLTMLTYIKYRQYRKTTWTICRCTLNQFIIINYSYWLYFYNIYMKSIISLCVYQDRGQCCSSETVSVGSCSVVRGQRSEVGALSAGILRCRDLYTHSSCSMSSSDTHLSRDTRWHCNKHSLDQTFHILVYY